MMSDVTLADFLLARIAEDEAFANAPQGDARWEPLHVRYEDWDRGVGDGLELIAKVRDEAEQKHIARWDPARVLAECEAKRQIIASVSDETVMCEVADDVLRLLATPYADHPDYRDEWRPFTP